jgi:hypothetical protein
MAATLTPRSRCAASPIGALSVTSTAALNSGIRLNDEQHIHTECAMHLVSRNSKCGDFRRAGSSRQRGSADRGSRHTAAWQSTHSTTRLRPLRVALIAFATRGFFIRVAQIEFRMAALSLYDSGSLVQFSRFAPKWGLMLSFTRRGLVLTMSTRVGHDVAHLLRARGPNY